jgi:hypothetical protein
LAERTMAEAFDETLASQTPRPIGALPVIYQILETLISQKRRLCVRSDASPDGLVPADDILFACGTRGATQLIGCCAAAVAV